MNKLLNQKESPLITFLQDSFKDMPSFFEHLTVLNQEKQLHDREKMGEAVINLNKNHYSLLYKRIQGLGFSPNLNQDAITTEKEKYRVATFLIRQLTSMPREVNAVFAQPVGPE